MDHRSMGGRRIRQHIAGPDQGGCGCHRRDPGGAGRPGVAVRDPGRHHPRAVRHTWRRLELAGGITTVPSIAFTDIYPDSTSNLGTSSGGGAGGGGAILNELFPVMPAGATPVHRDITIAAAGTYLIWQPASDRTFVLASAFVSTDTAGRIALVDGADLQGQRPV